MFEVLIVSILLSLEKSKLLIFFSEVYTLLLLIQQLFNTAYDSYYQIQLNKIKFVC